MAAAGLSTQPLFLLIGPFAGLGEGLGALVARFVGRGDRENARTLAGVGLTGAWAASVMDWAVRAALLCARIRQRRWQDVAI